MRLSVLAAGYPIAHPRHDPDVTLLTEDSRKVRPGAIFVAITGTADDGHRYVKDALDRGAAAVVVQRQEAVPAGAPAIVVPSTRDALAVLAARFNGEPARGLHLIGFTGTFGKTTTSDILRVLLEAAGARPGVLGSLGARYGAFADRGEGLTTPSPPDLHRMLRSLAAAGADTVIMEVTSHALRLGRVHGLTFGGGLLSAIVPGEHTDFHRSYEDYVAAKGRLLEHLAPDAVLAFDADNRAARRLAHDARVRVRSGFTVEGEASGGLHAIGGVHLDLDGATFTVDGERVRSALLGRPNVRNAALAVSYALAAGVPMTAIRSRLAAVTPLPRRMQRTEFAGRILLDDTSGHPDSLAPLFEVAALIPRQNLWIAWALRGSRGPEINRRNALALADVAALHEAAALIVTASEDATTDKDRVKPEEIDAVSDALARKGRPHAFHMTLEGAMKDLAARCRAGDVIVLTGAQGMDDGARRLVNEVR